MVLRGAQIRRCGQARSYLASAGILPYDLAQLCGLTDPSTSADFDGLAGSCLEEIQVCINAQGLKSFPATRSKRRKARLPCKQLPDAERVFYVPGHCSDHTDAVHLNCRDAGLVR
jgi:hypothetical protein